jgi:hypothetical protein
MDDSAKSEYQLAQIPSLRGLRRLNLMVRRLEWAWCQLPTLQELSLGHECRICDTYDFSDNCNIEYLDVTVTTDIMLRPCVRYSGLESFLSRCPKIKSLALSLCNSGFADAWSNPASIPPTLSQNCIGAFSTLTDRISSLRGSLENLVIRNEFDTPPDYLQYITPLTSLAAFTSIKYLMIPVG